MDDEYVEAVLDVVAAVPAGRATTYGLIAEALAERLGRGGPRQVGTVLSRTGGDVPWWRVVNASGAAPAHLATAARDHWRAEATPRTADGERVALRRAVWWPDDEPSDEPGGVARSGRV